MNDKQKEWGLICADFIETIPKSKWDYLLILSNPDGELGECGTVGCAIGWLIWSGYINSPCLKLPDLSMEDLNIMVANEFGLPPSETEFLFFCHSESKLTQNKIANSFRDLIHKHSAKGTK